MEHFLRYIPLTITAEMNQKLLCPLTEAEVENAVFSMAPFKTPGPDDDSLIFCQASCSEVRSVKRILSAYELASGQVVNFSKSSIFFSKNTSPFRRRRLCSILGIGEEGLKAKYLGMPAIIGRSKSDVFHFVSQKVQDRLSAWKAKYLSKGGKEVLIKAVLSSLPTYVMSCFRLPASLCEKIMQLIRAFWWRNNPDSRSVHWSSWASLCLSKKSWRLGNLRHGCVQLGSVS
ncbi:uncharacterized protein LOC132271532 isoform X2 [Cornus florida]|uniref:uncharacterized protein LOC132271532 isoform X2 n=1 Tax=Cornus florida TaxID=4283 RepID=UPI002899F21B|nr:uncharacterized protein LOC132271532 isoform X2 [Cornus florida]